MLILVWFFYRKIQITLYEDYSANNANSEDPRVVLFLTGLLRQPDVTHQWAAPHCECALVRLRKGKFRTDVIHSHK